MELNQVETQIFLGKYGIMLSNCKARKEAFFNAG